ncbi:T9SS type A sorting domain-containing protein [Hymenobacter cellulosivorans]|uniref:T9SS type A sorting domain-containing protein n=1 Tax=Hymenobacter cellulosivorans TaxID=2932249 RepID=A0ABY4F8Z1_9BACT|nr:T9SS type A sorting domain-containing protein [Hymenobacter cellulosivorans]UOQ52681.1 T9SS type A sorting domain-containing protein [Hymenobacter cellulosivorans]
MKKTFLRFLLTALTSAGALTAASAQALPNGNFENWETRGATLAPVGWVTLDDAFGLPISSGTVTRSSDKNGGQYAALLENKPYILPGVTFPGVLAIGTNADPEADLPGGVPFTGRPANMQFHYKLTGTTAASEIAGVQVALTRWTGTETVIVAAGGAELAPAANYTLETVPLEYESSATPDSIRIIFASGTSDEPTVGTALLIDDVVMTGTALATVNAARNAAVSVSPNPSTGVFTLSTSRDASWTRSAYTVTDVAGRVVQRGAAAPVNASGQRTVDLRGQRAGMYTLRLDTPEGPVVHKLLLQ